MYTECVLSEKRTSLFATWISDFRIYIGSPEQWYFFPDFGQKIQIDFRSRNLRFFMFIPELC